MSTSPLSKMYWLHAITPLHVGAGRGVGFVDLPIMRERVTGWPLVPGSAIKGVLASHHNATVSQRIDCEKRRAAFGTADGAGALVFTDARLVCLPVRSLFGTFAWVTSPIALYRLARDAHLAASSGVPAEIPTPSGQCLLSCTETALAHDGRAYFEDLDFGVTLDGGATAAWGAWLATAIFDKDSSWGALFRMRFAIVADAVFDFLTETATEVSARVRIDENYKTVAKGALWYEESLPAESILAGVATCGWVGGNRFQPGELLEAFCKDEAQFQLGGKATTGKGVVRCRFVSAATGAPTTVIV